MDFATQPRCPTCNIIMRDIQNGWTCAVCGHTEHVGDIPPPPVFTGPTIHGG